MEQSAANPNDVVSGPAVTSKEELSPFHKELLQTASNDEQKTLTLEPHGRGPGGPGVPGGGGGPRPEPRPPRPEPRPEPRPPRPEPRPEPRPPRPEPRPEPRPPRPEPRPEPRPPRPEPRPEPRPPRPDPRPEPRPPRPDPRPEPRPPRPEPKPEPRPPRPEPKPEPRPPRPDPKPEPKPEPRPPRPEPRPEPRPPRPDPKPEPRPPRPDPKPEPRPPRPDPRPEPRPPRPDPRPEPRPPRPDPRPEPGPHPHPPRPPRPEPRPPRPEPHPPRPEPHPPRPEPHPPRPEPRPEPPHPRPPHDRPHPPSPWNHHPYRDCQWYRPDNERWGWHDRDRWNRGWDPWFWRQSPNHDRWEPLIEIEARQIADKIEAGKIEEATDQLKSELYDLRYDRYAQNRLLSTIAEDLRRDGTGAALRLDNWNPYKGSWDTIEIIPPPPPAPPPDQPIPEPPAPTPVPTYDEDPWMQTEAAVTSSLLDAGDTDAAANRLNSDLYTLRGNMEAQNVLLTLVEKGDRKGAGTDLELGDWDPDTGTYKSIEIRPPLTDPGSGVPVKTYDDVNAQKPDGVIDTSKSNDAKDPWQHQEIAVIAAFLDAGDAKAAATRLLSDLQELRGDLDSQNAMILQIIANHQKGNGADLNIGAWDPDAGTYKDIEIVPAGAAPGDGIKIKTYPQVKSLDAGEDKESEN